MGVIDKVADKVSSLLPIGRERRTPESELAPLGSEVLALRDNLDRWLQRFFDEPWGFPSVGQFELAPSTNMDETEKEYVMTIEVPGLDPGDVDITIRGNSLTIRGEKRDEREEVRADIRVSERRYGTFVRTIPFPEDADLERADARVERGVLTVRVPKREPRAAGRRVPITG
jgi:HSP20 family protein